MKKIISFSLLSIFVAGLTSCLKDKSPNLSENTPALIEWSTNAVDAPAGTNSSGFTRYSRTFDAATSVDMVVTVNYTGSGNAPSDITVGLGVNDAAVAAFNAATTPAGGYTVLPASLYTMPTSVVIPAGQRSASITVSLKTAQFDFTKAYLLPLSITSTTAGAISSNYGTVLYNIGAKNQWDGVYKLKGYVVRQGDTDGLMGFTVPNIANRSLVTTGANSVSLVQLWANGGGIAGIDGTTITVNPTTNKVTMSATSNPALVNLPTYDNRYDPATKTFYLSFYWGNGPSHRAATDTLEYIGPR